MYNSIHLASYNNLQKEKWPLEKYQDMRKDTITLFYLKRYLEKIASKHLGILVNILLLRVYFINKHMYTHLIICN